MKAFDLSYKSLLFMISDSDERIWFQNLSDFQTFNNNALNYFKQSVLDIIYFDA